MKVLLFLCLVLLSSSTALTSPGPVLVAEVASATTFRLGVRFGGWSTLPLKTPSVDSSTIPAPSTPVRYGNMTGVKTTFGALLTDGISAWAFYDSQNNTLVASAGVPTLFVITQPECLFLADLSTALLL